MLFYILLFVTCVIVAVGFLFLYRSLDSIGKSVFQAFLPTAGKKKVRAKSPRARTLATSVNETPTPWGWAGTSTAGRAARARPTALQPGQPAAWPGNHGGANAHGGGNGNFADGRDDASKPASIVNPNVGWPYREEKFELEGRNRKAARKTTPKPTDLSKTEKPWGW